MKRWKSILLTAVLALALTAPAFGFGDTEVDIGNNAKIQGATGDGNIGIQTNGTVKDNNFGTQIEGGVTAEGGNASANSNNMIGNTVFGDTFSPSSSSNSSVGDLDNSNTQTMIGGGNAASVFGDANTGNIQDQDQDQDQAQIQGQHQGQNNNQVIAPKQKNTQTNKQTTVIKQKYVEAENKRNLPSGHGAAYNAKGPDYREKAKDTANVAPMDELLSIRKVFTLAQLKVLAGRSGLDYQSRVLAYNSHRVKLDYPKSGTKGMSDSLTITVVTDTPKGLDMAFIRVDAEEVEVDTINVFALAAIEAIRHGASHLYIAKADFVRMMNAEAWGLMLGGSGTLLMADGGSNAGGAVIAPGIGYGESTSGYEGLPYIRAYAFE